MKAAAIIETGIFFFASQVLETITQNSARQSALIRSRRSAAMKVIVFQWPREAPLRGGVGLSALSHAAAHVGFDPGLVNEDQPRGVNLVLVRLPALPLVGDVGSIPLGGLFF